MKLTALITLSACLAVAASCGSDKKRSTPAPKKPTAPVTAPAPIDPNATNPGSSPGNPGTVTPVVPGSDAAAVTGNWVSQPTSGNTGSAELTFDDNGQFQLKRYVQQGRPAYETRAGSYSVSNAGNQMHIDLKQQGQSDKKPGQGQGQNGGTPDRVIPCIGEVTVNNDILQLRLNCAWGGGSRPTTLEDFSDVFTRSAEAL